MSYRSILLDTTGFLGLLAIVLVSIYEPKASSWPRRSIPNRVIYEVLVVMLQLFIVFSSNLAIALIYGAPIGREEINRLIPTWLIFVIVFFRVLRVLTGAKAKS